MGLESLSTYAQSSNSLLATVLIILLLPLFRYAYLDYQGWYALGGGGLPHNALGWLVQSLLRLPASRRVRDSSCYDAATGSTELEKTSFFDDELPKWTGEAPKTAVWVVPHRQVEQVAGAKIKKVRLLVSDEAIILWVGNTSHTFPRSYLKPPEYPTRGVQSPNGVTFQPTK